MPDNGRADERPPERPTHASTQADLVAHLFRWAGYVTKKAAAESTVVQRRYLEGQAKGIQVVADRLSRTTILPDEPFEGPEEL